MDMTLEAFAALEPGSYVLLDIRNAQSREYGCIPGSLAMPREVLEDCTLPHDGRKLIVYCARGQFSREAAEMLAKQGIAVRAGLHCAPLAHESAGTLETGTVRVSFGWDNTSAQTEAFLSAATKFARFRK